MLKLEKGRPADCAGRLEKEVRTYDFLDKLNIEYERIDHEAAMTMEECADVDEALGAMICKNLFLCNRQETTFYLLMIPGDKKFKTKDLSAPFVAPVFCKRDVYGGVFRHHARVGQCARSDERQGTPCPASGGPGCAERRLHRVPSVHQHVQPSHKTERHVGKNCSGAGTRTGLCDIGRTTGVSRYEKENADK